MERLRKALFYSLVLLAGFLSCIGGLFFYIYFNFSQNLPDWRHLDRYQPAGTSRIYSRHYELVRECNDERRIFVPFSEIPTLVVKAFLSAEDKNFFTHPGVDVWSLLRAVILNTLKGSWSQRPIGGSTITQQVAKNFLLGNERSLKRKVREAILSLQLEKNISKERILELYLNNIYLGNNSYGVAAASQSYFGKILEELSPEEVAFLAALPKAPSFYSKDLEKLERRRNWVLKRMLHNGILSQDTTEKAMRSPISFADPPAFPELGNYFVSEVRREVFQRNLDAKGCSVISTVDLRLQQLAEVSLQEELEKFDFSQNQWRGPLAHISQIPLQWSSVLESFQLKKPHHVKAALVMKIEGTQKAILGLSNQTFQVLSLSQVPWRYAKDRPIRCIQDVLSVGDIVWVRCDNGSLFQLPKVTGGLVLMDPYDGSVLALSGGYLHSLNAFNVVTQAKRQPGSTFKPIVYLAALEQGFKLQNKILDAAIHLSLGNGSEIYSPKNESSRSYGLVSLQTAFTQSLNLATVRLALKVGLSPIQLMASRLGIYSNTPNKISIALGAFESTLLNLTTAYGMILNGGYKIQPSFIQRIIDVNGKVIYGQPFYSGYAFRSSSPFLRWGRLNPEDYPAFYEQKNFVLTPKAAKIMTYLLEETVNRGTARGLQNLKKELGIRIGGKTGTTNNNKDTWFIGFIRLPNNRLFIIGAFIGYPVPKSLGAQATGGKIALPLFERFVRKAFPILSEFNYH